MTSALQIGTHSTLPALSEELIRVHWVMCDFGAVTRGEETRFGRERTAKNPVRRGEHALRQHFPTSNVCALRLLAPGTKPEPYLARS